MDSKLQYQRIPIVHLPKNSHLLTFTFWVQSLVGGAINSDEIQTRDFFNIVK